MKKHKSLLPALLIILFIVSGFLHEVKGQVEGEIEGRIEGRWNGTISLYEKYEGTLGLNEKWINVSIIDNKGTGTIKIEGENKILGKTSCSGAGVVELYSLAVNLLDSIYSFSIISPPCNSADDPNGNTQDVTISDHSLRQSHNYLSGTETTVAQMPNGEGTTTQTITWTLVRSLDVVLIVTPQNYDNWLPVPGKDEMRKGSVMNISLKLQGKNNKPLTVKAKSFELLLSNTSTEPGITINFPTAPGNPGLPDLRFLEVAAAESIEEDQYIEIPCADGVTGKAYIGSYDGGGWTTLTVIAILEDNNQIKGSLLVPGGEQEIRIPKRDLNSKIAKAWLTANGNPNEMDDKDSSSGNPNKGDGFTAYEEYRGVIAEGKFKRFNPKKKELGILGKQTDFTLFNDGISWFKTSSDLEAVKFDLDKKEINFDWRLNINFKTAHDYDQYALFLLDGALRGSLGQVFSKTNKPDIPAQIISVVVDWNAIQSAYQRRVNFTLPERLKFSLREYLAQTIAHELGHAVNVWHHGRDIKIDSFKIIDPVDRIFRRNGSLITDRPIMLYSIGEIRNTVESGDLKCILNYYPYYRWGYTRGADGAKIFNQEPLITLGRSLCKSINGTEFNTTLLYFGDGAKGNCLGQIKLRN